MQGVQGQSFNNLLSQIKYTMRRHGFIVFNKPEIVISAFLLTREY